MTSSRWAAACLLADRAAPYLACARSSMITVFTDKVETMAVDQHWRCYVNPTWTDSLQAKQAGYVILHELAHLLRDHAGRCKAASAQHKPWNIAADMEVNCDSWEGLSDPPGGIKAKDFDMPEHLMVEQYYRRLPKKGEGKGKGKGEDKDGGKPGKEPASGSCSDGVTRDYELPKGDKDAPAMTDIEKKIVELKVAQAIQDHEAAKGRGSVPGQWSVWSGSILKPRVDWRKQFRYAVSAGLARVGLGHQTYRRTRIRNGICLPRHDRMDPVVCIVCDTSGSMSGSPLQRAVSECVALGRQMGGINVVWTDTECHLQRAVRSGTELRMNMNGGTDMREGIAFAEKLRNTDHPDVIVTITDGDTPWPYKAPKIPHIAVIVGKQKGPSFGTVINVPDTVE